MTYILCASWKVLYEFEEEKKINSLLQLIVNAKESKVNSFHQKYPPRKRTHLKELLFP